MIAVGETHDRNTSAPDQRSHPRFEHQGLLLAGGPELHLQGEFASLFNKNRVHLNSTISSHAGTGLDQVHLLAGGFSDWKSCCLNGCAGLHGLLDLVGSGHAELNLRDSALLAAFPPARARLKMSGPRDREELEMEFAPGDWNSHSFRGSASLTLTKRRGVNRWPARGIGRLGLPSGCRLD